MIQFLYPDGQYRTTGYLTTSIGSRFFYGSVPESATDVQVSINDVDFASDADLVSFAEGTFTIPNPSAFPDGWDLEGGTNTIRVRYRDLSTYSEPATIVVEYVESYDASILPPPTALRVERFSNSIVLRVNEIAVDSDDLSVTGYNFYASTEAGGGQSGYTRINALPISDLQYEVARQSIATVDTNYPIVVSDIPYVRVVGTQESSDSVTAENFDERIPIPSRVTRVETRVSVSAVEQQGYVEFRHVRNANPSSSPSTVFVGQFASTPSDIPLYYVVSAVYYDSLQGIEYESSFSPEVSASPILIDTSLTTLPATSRDNIIQDVVLSIHRTNPNLAIQPGSVIRDTFVDPFSSEAERLRFVIDFVYRASSFSTLLAIDDPEGNGSIPVQDSAYKKALGTALFLTNDTAIQNVIDRAFDKIASDYGVYRKPGNKARGEFVFYLNRRPERTYDIPLGIQIPGPVVFRTTEASRIPVENSAAYYDPSRNRYAVRVAVEAVDSGTAGNLAIGQIQTSYNGLMVTNESRTFGGSNIESNFALASRAQSAIASVDSGTRMGYYKTAIESAGVVDALVVESGDALMQRDYADGRHYGGKVDVWVQGESLANVTDTFAFTYRTVRDAQFVPVGNPSNLLFQVVGSDVSEDNPIAEILNYPSLNLGLRNVSNGESYDLTNAVVSAFNLVQLDVSIPQPSTSLTDVIIGDFRFRSSNAYVFAEQPVKSVISLQGEGVGVVENFELVRTQDPLIEGRSSRSSDYLSVTDPSVLDTPINVTGEIHVVVANNPEYVNRLGANPLSIRVFNQDRSVEYDGPGSENPDYSIVDGDQRNALSIVRTTGSDIVSGQTLLIDYSHAPNFTVRYATNLIVSSVQQQLDTMRHATANVLAKAAIDTPVDISITVVSERGAKPSTVDSKIRNALSGYFGKARLSNPVRPSDIIAVVEDVQGVSYVITPISRMGRSSGSLVLREAIGPSYRLIPEWSNGSNLAWLMTTRLDSSTTDGGGSNLEYRGVFRNDDPMTLLVVGPETVASAPYQSYIIGNQGIEIPSFTDNTTLSLEYNTDSKRIAARSDLSGDRILVSLPVGESPSANAFYCTYIVQGDVGVKEVNPGKAEFLSVGDIQITYEEARENSIRR